MIKKYPIKKLEKKDTNETVCSLKAAVDAGMVSLGQRYMVEGKPVTCVDIDNNKYIFSMDEIYICEKYSNIMDILTQIYETGNFNNTEILPINMMKDIDFLFIPSEYQIFGTNESSLEKENEDVKQFEWYKRNVSVKIKSYCGTKSSPWNFGNTCNWWLSNLAIHNNNIDYYSIVNFMGSSSRMSEHGINCGIPIFIQITRE